MNDTISQDTARMVDPVRTMLDAVLGTILTPTGTPAAQALHHLFLSEARQAGWDRAESAWLAMEAAVVADVLGQLERITGPHPSPDFALPAGTVMMEYMTGAVCIGCDTLGFDVDRPGLHPVADLPDHPGGSNLTLLLNSIDELSRDQPFRTVGLPTAVVRLDGRHPSHRLQFPPYGLAGGAVLQRKLDFSSWGELFCAFTHEMVVDLARSVVIDMAALWARPGDVVQEVVRAREWGDRVARGIAEVGVHAITVELGKGREVAHAIEFEAWDHAFRRGVVTQYLGTRGDPPDDLPLPFGLRRAGAVAKVRSLGADGHIDGIARAVIAAAPEGGAALLAELASQFETFTDLPALRGPPFRFRLSWWEGVIGAETSSTDRLVVISGKIVVKGLIIPESIILNLPGRPVHEALDGPFRCDAQIARLRNIKSGVIIEADPDLRLVDCLSGKWWPDDRPAAPAESEARNFSDPRRGRPASRLRSSAARASSECVRA